MRSKLMRLSCAAVALVVTGCETIQDTLGPTGPKFPPESGLVPGDVSCATASTQFTHRNQYTLFKVAYYCAWDSSLAAAQGGDLEAAQPQLRAMAREGFGLVRGNCSEFFRKRGDSQQLINLGRDAVAIGGTTATAIVGLAGGSVLALSLIALSGATLYGGIDTYTKNFLFGAENIDAVRTNTLTALSANANAVLNSNNTLDFQAVADTIMENQELCRPAAIAAAARIAIRDHSLTPVGENAGANLQMDGTRIAMIGQVAGYPAAGTLDDSSLAALCWGARVEALPESEGTRKENLLRKLLPIKPFGNGPNNAPGWATVSPSIDSSCRALSATTKAAINKRIEAWKTQVPGMESGGGSQTPVSSSRTGPSFIRMR
jgi:hypothetical protein